MKVLFRFDCGPGIGLGHAMRCLAVANALKKQNVLSGIAYREASSRHITRYLLDGISSVVIPNGQELFEFLPLTKEPLPDVLVVDHYGEGRLNLSALLFKDIRKVLIDDFEILSDLPCETLINPNRSAEMIPSTPVLRLLGPKYAPIRDEICQLAGRWQAAPRQDTPDECLISMGATDPWNLTSLILLQLARHPIRKNFIFRVVLSSSAPHLEAVIALAEALRSELNVNILIDAGELGALYKQAHCCIGAAGSSAWERCCIGLPTAQVVVADNQQQIQRELLTAGAIWDLPHPTEETFVAILSDFLRSAVERHPRFLNLSVSGISIVDGKGAQRIAQALAGELK